MTKFMGISCKKLASMGCLLAVLLITLILGSITFLINDNPSRLPDVGLGAGLEGNCNKNEGMSEKDKTTMDKNNKDLIKNMKNAPAHSMKPN